MIFDAAADGQVEPQFVLLFAAAITLAPMDGRITDIANGGHWSIPQRSAALYPVVLVDDGKIMPGVDSLKYAAEALLVELPVAGRGDAQRCNQAFTVVLQATQNRVIDKLAHAEVCQPQQRQHDKHQ